MEKEGMEEERRPTLPEIGSKVQLIIYMVCRGCCEIPQQDLGQPVASITPKANAPSLSPSPLHLSVPFPSSYK